MKQDSVFAIFDGCYSDWSAHGYFNTKDEADKYCAIKKVNEHNNYYVEELKPIIADVSNVQLKYYHTVVFDLNDGMRKENNRYECYTGEDKKSKITYNIFGNGLGWISFGFTCESREKAEKIAQDKYAEFLYYYSENKSFKKSMKLMGGTHYSK